MTLRTFAIFVSERRWHVSVVAESTSLRSIDIEPGETTARIAERVAIVLHEEGYDGSGVLLGLPSDACLSAMISLQGLPRKNRREAMLYRLEEQLPLAIEDIDADFLIVGEQALGVCVVTNRIKPLIESLETAGINVQHLCPTALLASQSLWNLTPLQADVLLWHNGDTTDLIRINASGATAWTLVSSEIDNLLVHLRHIALQSGGAQLRVRISGVDADLAEDLSRTNDIQLIPSPVDKTMLTAAADCANRVLRGVTSPWIELRRGALGATDILRPLRLPLRWTIGAVIILFVSISATLLWRAEQYRRLTTDYQARQQEIFRKAFPGQTLPAGVKMRLVSEERKLRGLSGEASELPPRKSALLILHHALGALPAELRYRLTEIRCGVDHVYLEGQVRSHTDADALASALRSQKKLTIEAPRTEQLTGGGVGFTITATPANEKLQTARNTR